MSSPTVMDASHPLPPPDQPPPARPSRWRRIRRSLTSLRAQLTYALWIPAIIAVAIVGVFGYQTAQGRTHDRGVSMMVQFTRSMQDYSVALNEESRAAFELDGVSYAAAQENTKAKLKALETEIARQRDEIPSDLRPMVDALLKQNTQVLDQVRQMVGQPGVSAAAIIDTYFTLRTYVSGVPPQYLGSISDEKLREEIQAQAAIATLSSRLAVEQTLLELEAKGAEPGAADYVSRADVGAAIRASIGDEQSVQTAFAQIGDPPDVGSWSSEVSDARQAEAVFVGVPLGAVFAAQTGQPAESFDVPALMAKQLSETSSRISQTWTAARNMMARDIALAKSVANEASQQIALSIGLGLLIIVTAIGTVPLLTSRAITPLTRLIGQTERQIDRLPEQLAAVEHGETAPKAEKLEAPGAVREVRQFANQLDVLIGTSYDLATREARRRTAVVGMLRTVALREAQLVNRQLELLDKYERHEVDPVFLSRLFNLDHVTTQMRRMCDSLLILGGGTPVRRTTPPLSLVDVVRGASSQIEQYSRIDLDVWYDPRVHGHRVSDLTLLIAELLDNATKFSHPDTRVTVTFTRGDHAAVVAIADQGIGIDDDVLATAKRQIDNPGEDAFGTFDRLGLQTVARLCERTGATVEFTGGTGVAGTTVTVLLPDTLLANVSSGSALRMDPSMVGDGFDDSVHRPAAITLYGSAID